MRKFLSIILSLVIGGCSGFLDEISQDQMTPTKTEHYASVLLNCIKYDYPVFSNVDYMSDNLTEYSRANKKPGE